MSDSLRHYRRRHRNSRGTVIEDAGLAASGFGPKGAFITGLVGFFCFYFAGPHLLESWLEC